MAIKDIAMLERNIQSALTPLSDYERTVLEDITREFFEPLSVRHWEGKEVQQYWKELNSLKQ